MRAGSTANIWFEALTGYASPQEWQKELMEQESCRDLLIRIPTGLGKTEGVLAAWSLHRIFNQDECWPRRLVWCLPMRVLVEQTEHVARALSARMPAPIRPDVHVVMGGEDAGEWFLYPERPAILVGTQDMLLSRALNRGYGSGRARWPVEFGLLNQDALWVVDEVQLMDVGLATSARLQAFREDKHAQVLAKFIVNLHRQRFILTQERDCDIDESVHTFHEYINGGSRTRSCASVACAPKARARLNVLPFRQPGPATLKVFVVGDCGYLGPEDRDGARYMSLMTHANGRANVRRLCRRVPGETQESHGHPVFSGDDRWVLFNSRIGPRENIFMPDVQSI